jgi:hypothetical protein
MLTVLTLVMVSAATNVAVVSYARTRIVRAAGLALEWRHCYEGMREAYDDLADRRARDTRHANVRHN